jgi:hypothetical protein
MAHQPSRPFESLEWYRDAARNNFRDDRAGSSLAQWARGFGMLHAHISLFAISIVVLLAINLLRDPENIWADRWIMGWTVLILIHAVIVGVLWAIAQWNTDAPDEALLMNGSRNGWQQSQLFAWGSSQSAQDVDFRMRSVETTEATPPVEAETPGWTGWNADGEPGDVPESERASWQEASAAAWLDRSDKTPKPASDNGDPSPS